MGSIALWIIIPSQIDLSRVISSKYSINAQFLPKMVAVVIFILGVSLIIQSLILKIEKIYTFETSKEVKPLLFYVILILYVLLISYIGFLVPSLIMSCSVLLFLGSKRVSHYIIVISIVVAINFIFKLALNVPLP
jgi:hypothetical protein